MKRHTILLFLLLQGALWPVSGQLFKEFRCEKHISLPVTKLGPLIYREDFDNMDKLHADWSEGKNNAEVCEVRDGMLYSKCGTGANQRMTTWVREKISGPFYLEFSYRKTSGAQGLSILAWGARTIDGTDFFSLVRGDQFGLMTDANMECYHISFSRAGTGVSNFHKNPPFHDLVADVPDPLNDPGNGWHKIGLYQNGSHILFFVDGKLIHDVDEQLDFESSRFKCKSDHAASASVVKSCPGLDARKIYTFSGSYTDFSGRKSSFVVDEPGKARVYDSGYLGFRNMQAETCIDSLRVWRILPATYRADAQLPAFPGATGFGSLTRGGRGGRVIEVTNLNESGPGSFRAACEASGARTIVFRTGGLIRATENISIRNPYVTIAGQTAPGDGICLQGTLTIGTHDVVLRNMRIRPGDGPGVSPENRDGLQIENKDSAVWNVLVDHCSISWATDEVCTIYFPTAHDITISNSIIAQGLYHSIHPEGRHAMGTLSGPGTRNVSYIGNLMAHNGQRNPRIQGSVAVINNLVYNRMEQDVNLGGNPDAPPLNVTVKGNQFIKGPDAGNRLYSVYVYPRTPAGSRLYVDDNISTYTTGNIIENARYITLVDEPPVWPDGVIAQPAESVYEQVLANAGAIASRRDEVDSRIVNDVRNRTGGIIDCVGPGEIVNSAGSVQGAGTTNTIIIAGDSRAESHALTGFLIAVTSGTGSGQVRTITGNDEHTKIVTVSENWDVIPDESSRYKIFCDCKKNAGGWPVYSAGNAPDDSDHDGMPDDWERKHKLNPAFPSDGNHTNLSPEGYTNVEVYLNGLMSR